MDAMVEPARSIPAARREHPRLPTEDYLDQLHGRLKTICDGEVASYIPELGKIDPDAFGIALATVDGRVYTVGDCALEFTIQSVSKPFMYGRALERLGRDALLKAVGVEPTGEAFNSIVLDEVANRPFNPMVNAGAIAIAALIDGDTLQERSRNMLAVFADFAGRDLGIDEAVFRSEQATGHRNRAIAWMMLNTGMIGRPPEEVLDLYFRQCSVNVTCRDLSIMAATLANHGINPVSGRAALAPEHVRDVLSVMHSCGMYNYAGQWSYEVGMPAKSGVSGCIVAVMPGQMGLAIFSPRLDAHGNSVRGIRVCQEMSKTFELHAFDSRPSAGSIVRREYDAATVRSQRLRTPRERAILAAEGSRIVVLELQGTLYFGATECLLQRISALAADALFVIVDMHRLNLADKSSCQTVAGMAQAMSGDPCRMLFAGLDATGPLGVLHDALAEAGETVYADADAALEWCEDELLGPLRRIRGNTKYALSELDILQGLDAADLKRLESIVRPLLFEPGQTIIHEGDAARLFFAIAKGTVSVRIRVPGPDGNRMRRVACIGPGLTFGEMALLDGRPRSADVIADEMVVCYGFAVEQLREVAADAPHILIAILSNLTREFSERLRHANAEIRSLE